MQLCKTTFPLYHMTVEIFHKRGLHLLLNTGHLRVRQARRPSQYTRFAELAPLGYKLRKPETVCRDVRWQSTCRLAKPKHCTSVELGQDARPCTRKAHRCLTGSSPQAKHLQSIQKTLTRVEIISRGPNLPYKECQNPRSNSKHRMVR